MSRFISLSSTIRTFAIGASCCGHSAGHRNFGRNRDHEYSMMLEVSFNRNIATDELDEFQPKRQRDADTTIFGGAVVGPIREDVEQNPGIHVLGLGLGIADANPHPALVSGHAHLDLTGLIICGDAE